MSMRRTAARFDGDVEQRIASPYQRVRGATSFAGGSNQNFYNVEWNCPSQTGSTILGFGGDTLGGYFKVVTPIPSSLLFRQCERCTTINGDVIVQGEFCRAGTSSATADTVYHYGNISVTAAVSHQRRKPGWIRKHGVELIYR